MSQKIWVIPEYGQLLPKEYYLHSLERIRIEMLSRNMEVLPEMVRILCSATRPD